MISSTRTKRRKTTGGKTHKRHNKNKLSYLKTFIKKMFTLQLTLKMVHWTTKSHAVHKTTDDALDKVMPLIDSFVETFLGKYKFGVIKQNIIKNIDIESVKTKKELNLFIDRYVKYLTSLETLNNNNNNQDLLGIRDNLLSELNILRYLVHLEK